MTASAADMRRILPTLDSAQFTTLTHTVLGLKTAADRKAVSPADRLRMGAWEFLLAVGVTDAQARLVLREAVSLFEDAAGDYEAWTGGPLSAHKFGIADRRFVGWTASSGWFDLRLEEWVAALPEPAVMTITCDLTALFLRQRRWLAKLGVGTDAGHRHHAPGDGAHAAG